VTARSGGHSYAAYGLGGQDGNLVVDLRRLNEITLNEDNTVVSGTGNRLGDLATGIYNAGRRGLPHGTCPYVGKPSHSHVISLFGAYLRDQVQEDTLPLEDSV